MAKKAKSEGDAVIAAIKSRLPLSAGIADFAAWRFKDEWQIIRWIRGNGEDVTYVIGPREDTAAEVVDTLLRLAAEWSER